MTAVAANAVPGVVAKPPKIYLAFLAVGVTAEALWPSPMFDDPWWRLAGAAFVAAGLVLMMVAYRQFTGRGTPVETDRPSNVLVTDGVYGYSRNPMYAAFMLLYVGIALAANSGITLALLVPVWAVMRWGVIAREERYLESRFGDAYRSYRARVRRWV
jgi:protein-S-isoprenylcysteine O-methyltransferase Ste14